MAIQDYLTGINRATSGQQEDVKTATNDLSTYQIGAGNLPAKLKEALNTKLNSNQDIIEQQSETMKNYFGAGAAAREKYKDIWDPFKKANLVEQEKTMALQPYDTLSGVLSQRMGTISDIVNAGISGWQGLVNAASTKLGAAKDALGTALQAYTQAASQQQAADDMAMKKAAAAEAERQFNLNYGLDVKKVENQNAQFYFDQANRLKIAGMSSGASSKDEKNAQNTVAAWNEVLTASGGNPSKAWAYIHSHEDAWGKAGIDMNTIWSGYAKIGGSSTPASAAPAASSGGGWLSGLFGGGDNSFANTQLDLTTGKVKGNPVPTGPKVLKPGDPGYADLSKISYLKGYNLGP